MQSGGADNVVAGIVRDKPCGSSMILLKRGIPREAAPPGGGYSLWRTAWQLERCLACGIPLGVARCQWDLDKGIITDRDSARRMAIFGPGAADAAFEDLEAELGETIPETVIGAQRQYVKASMKSEDYHNFTSGLEEVLAIRGVGMLARFEADDRHISVTIENACLHLWMVGIIQGLFELGTDNSTTSREWNLSSEGVLTVTVRA